MWAPSSLRRLSILIVSHVGTILAGVFLRGVGAIGVDERSQRSAQELQEESDSDTVNDSSRNQ
jgi:hypothetical protein